MTDKEANVRTDIVDEQEFEAAVAEARKTEGKGLYSYTVQFKQPFSYEGKNYDSLSFDWTKLTGKDFLAIEEDMALHRKQLINAEFSNEFLLQMALRACRQEISKQAFCALPIATFNRICSRERSFLMAAQA